MKSIDRMSAENCASIQAVGFDIDDTLTTDGRLTADAFSALWRLYESGLVTVAVTGRPAGWCDMIARNWPVSAVVGENGALAYVREGDRVHRHDFGTPPAAGRRSALAEVLLDQFPHLAVASDQFTRRFDLAIDFAEEVGPYPIAEAEALAQACRLAGATAKVSSIHVNTWFGDWDKASALRRLLDETYGIDLSTLAYIGDSPNDAPLFAAAGTSVGVANLTDFPPLTEPPEFLTSAPRGAGFAQFVEHLLAARSFE
jgi:HAD superfamily hydrolase (TIGR01484 family)